MSSDDPKFACPSCGKQYRWKPEMAGRSAKCACGAKLVVPTERPVAVTAPPPSPPPPAAPPKPTPAPTPPIVKAAAPTTNCPICKSPVPAGGVLCVKCGYNFKTGKRLAAVVVETEVVEEEPQTSETAEAPAKSAPAAKPPT